MVVIPIEVKSRDLESRLAVAERLVEKGICVLTGSERSLLYLIQQISVPFVYFDKSISNNKHSLYKGLKDRGCKICSIDEEALSVVNNREGYVTKRFSSDNLQLVDKVFFWGKLDLDPIARIYPDYTEKFLVTGNPRLTLRSAFEIKQFDVAFISNFTVNHASGEANFWSKLEDLNRLSTIEDKIRYKRLVKKQKENFTEFIRLIKTTVAEFPEKTFVVRPHPSEDLRFWNALAKHYNNLVVDCGSREAIDTIRKSDIMIHMGCTTGLESVLAGVKTVAFLPKGSSVKSISNLVSHNAKTTREILELISLPELICSGIDSLDSHLILGNNSANIIAKNIIKLHSWSPTIVKIKFSKLSIAKLFFIKYRKYIPNHYGRKEQYEFRKFAGLTSKELNSHFISKEVKISQKAVDVFLIERHA